MYRIYSAMVLLCLATTVKCRPQDAGAEIVASVETAEAPATTVDTDEPENQPAQDTTTGLNAILLQVLGGLVQNSLGGQGVSTETVNSAINLFNPEKIKDNLLLLRRTMNFLVRLGLFLNTYLPRPSTNGKTFSILESLSSKFRLYAPQNDVQWVAITKNLNEGLEPLANVPERVQAVVDFATEKSTITSSAAVEVSSGGVELTQEVVTEEVVKESPTTTSSPVIIDNEIRVVQKETTVTTASSGSSSGSSSQNSNIVTNSQPNYPLPVQTPAPNQQITVNLGPGVQQAYELPSTNDKTIIPNRTVELYQVPSRNQVNQFPTLVNADKLNTNSNTVKVADRFNNPSSPIYAVPGKQESNKVNTKNNGIGEMGLPYPDRGEAFIALPYFQRGARFFGNSIESNAEKPKYGSIAEIPLEQHSIFDRRNGALRDSFGSPIRN